MIRTRKGESGSKYQKVLLAAQGTKPITRLAFVCLAAFFVQDAVSAFFPQATGKREQTAAFSFAGVEYFHRFTQADQHEYTPTGQENLQTWTDMVTLQFYRNAKDGDALAATANAVLTNYKTNKAVVVKTNSVPRTKDKPAEHLIVALFPRPKFIEAVFARFRLQNGLGAAIIYSHRVYGEKAGNEMSSWLEKNGATMEKNLMQWDAEVKLHR